jgi:hypothetical protein
MITLSAPSGASEALRHAVELVNRDLDGVLEKLDTKHQNLFWSDLGEYAQKQIAHEDRNAKLVAGDEVPELVRESLRDMDQKITTHVRNLSGPDRSHFWQMLNQAAERQAADTKSPKARFGGSGH